MNLAAFDLETARWSDPVDPRNNLGVTCAAVAIEKGGEEFIGMYCSIENRLTAIISPEGLENVDPEWSPKVTAQFLDTLLVLSQTHTICSWNGVHFDFHVLSVTSGLRERCVSLAEQHVDLMYLFQMVKGHRLSLKVAAEACGTHKGTRAVVSGEQAPDLWAEGRYVEVLQYVAQDALATLKVAQVMLRAKRFTWTAKSGRPMLFQTPDLIDPNGYRAGKVRGWPTWESMLDKNPHSAWDWTKEEGESESIDF